MSALHCCNHDAYVEHQHGQTIYRCGICGDVIWSHPTKGRIEWAYVAILAALILSVVGLPSWAIWIWLHAS